jgi:hypothetical protein
MIRFNITITRKRALMVIFAAVSIMIIDSTIVKYIAFSTQEFPTSTTVSIFISLALLFIGVSVVILGFIAGKESGSELKGALGIKNSYLLIFMIQISLIAILAILMLSIVVSQNYNILSLFAAIFVSHISALFFLLLLVLTLVVWIMVRMNKLLLLYSVSFSLLALTIIISLFYATNVLMNQPSLIKPYPIQSSLTALPRADLAIHFGPILDIISILSFISVWIVSAFLLSTYVRKIGKARYWAIIALPLVYILFPFEIYFLNIFQPLISTSPVSFALINSIFFGATKQIGGLFFSFAFLAASALLEKYVIHKYLLISAIGMAILFGSIDINSLLYATYPPFGLVTISFMAIGSYLVFNGISNSAVLVARDKVLRKEFYRNAMTQLDLLRVIGVSQMEKDLIDNYKSLEKRIKQPETTGRRFEKDNVREALHGLVDDLDKEDVREILHDVLDDVYSKSKSNTDIEGKDDFH